MGTPSHGRESRHRKCLKAPSVPGFRRHRPRSEGVPGNALTDSPGPRILWTGRNSAAFFHHGPATGTNSSFGRGGPSLAGPHAPFVRLCHSSGDLWRGGHRRGRQRRRHRGAARPGAPGHVRGGHPPGDSRDVSRAGGGGHLGSRNGVGGGRGGPRRGLRLHSRALRLQGPQSRTAHGPRTGRPTAADAPPGSRSQGPRPLPGHRWAQRRDQARARPGQQGRPHPFAGSHPRARAARARSWWPGRSTPTARGRAPP